MRTSGGSSPSTTSDCVGSASCSPATRPRPPQIQAARLAGGLCPRCGSPDHLPVVYGRLAEREALSRKYPEGFVAGGCYVESVEDLAPIVVVGAVVGGSGPAAPAEIWLGAVVRGGRRR
jgi:hypothetical protein